MSIKYIYIVIFGSVISLVGTMLGAFLGVIIKKPSKRLLGVLTGFAGGLMLSIVTFDLMPEAIKTWEFPLTFIFCAIGMLIIYFVDVSLERKNKKINSHKKVALMASLGLMIHNFPEGIIMGCGFAAGQILGVKMSIVISIHDIPEGMAVAAPLMASETKVSKILKFAFLTALPTAFGVLMGAFLGNVSGYVLGLCLSFASGIMIYVVCAELLPESHTLWGGFASTFGILCGILLGFAITNIF